MNANDIMTEYVTQSQLAAALGLTTKTLQRYGQLPDGLPSLRLGGKTLYRVSTVRDWIAKRETRPNPRRAGGTR
ncbi:hypothetical protein [Mesorhizobium sp.]|uniref:helix-turn-helix transcriptional regulator n=1 Tax=Mesorhizobium sp. TaxID=1871066 RepID=UPI00121384F2|nr:hypothetical protein [Mesorhizobium sp.]TIQ46730.1 MAG: helix-turn-helix domain-containing protein [Mesorhizobium sp.]TIQ56503.1 MAG: helix-turn-helix domain-containing protein [Mesorhizobium sp.]